MSAGDAFDLLWFLREQWDHEEMVAAEVSRCRGAEGVPVPEDWHWVCDECDSMLLATAAYGTEGLSCQHSSHGPSSVSLRSVQEYPFHSIGGTGPNFHLTPDGEVSHLLATYLMTYDPARVVADITAKREMVIEILNTAATIDGEWGCGHEADELREHCTDLATMRFLKNVLTPWAQAYRDHPGFHPDWKWDEPQ